MTQPRRLFIFSTLLSLFIIVGAGLLLVSRLEAAPIITAAKTEALVVDGDNDGEADPGDTLEYTVTINNNGDAAGNVQFSDTLDGHTALVNLAGSDFRTTPLARNDSYTSLGNVGITVPDGANDVLANDNDPDGTGAVALLGISGCADTTAPFVCAAVTANGGDVTLNANGSFTYDSAPGFEGNDSFTYTLQDVDGNQDSATVSLTVSGTIWFVDVTAAAGGDGRLNSPYNCLVGSNCFDDAPDGTGDNIFVADGSYTCGLTLLNNQKLIGDGSSSTLAAITGINLASFPFSNSLPAFSGTDPVLTSTNTDCITLAAGNMVRGLTIGDTGSGVGLADSGNVGTLTVSEVTINGTGGGIEVDNGGVLAVSLNSLSTSSSTDEGIHLANVSGSFTLPTGSISSSGAAGIIIDGNPSLALSVTLTDVSASAATTGISIKDMTGSFTVNGVGSTDGSGGVIQNITQRGIEVINGQNITLKNLNLTNATTTQSVSTGSSTCTDAGSGGSNTGCNAPIHLQNVTTVTLDNLNLDGSVQHGINGNNVSGLTVSNTNLVNIGNGAGENGLNFINLLGTSTFNTLDIDGSQERNARIENNSGASTINLLNSTIQNAVNEDGFLMIAGGSAVVNFNVTDNTFIDNHSLALKSNAEDSSTLNTTITGNTFNGLPSTVGNLGLSIEARDSATNNFEVIGSLANPQSFVEGRSHQINVFVFGGGTGSGIIQGNNITQAVVGAGIRVVAEVTTSSNPAITVDIDGNVIDNIQGSGLGGIDIRSRQGVVAATGVANIQATLNNNDVTINGADSVIQAFADSGNILCLDVTNNTAAGASTSPFAGSGSTHYLGNPVSGSSLGAGTVTYDGYLSGDLGGTWNANGNSPTLVAGISGEAFVDGTEPVNGACATVALRQPLDAGPMLAQTDAVTPPLGEREPVVDKRQMIDDERPLAGDHQPAAQNNPFTLHTSHSTPQNFPTRSAGLASPLRQADQVNVSLGTLDPGQVVTITFRATIDAPASAAALFGQVCNQGTISGAGFSNVLTDDPDTGTANDATCTPLDKGTLIIRKDAVPNSTLDFSFSASGGLAPANFSLDDDTNGTLSNEQTFIDVTPGQYTVSESNPQTLNFILADLVCVEDAANIISSTENVGTRQATINLDAGETVICTFTNEERGTITVNKSVIGAPPGDSWRFTAPTPPGNFIINAAGGGTTFPPLNSGIYTITEVLSSNYNTQVNCTNGDSGSNSVTVDLQPGQDVTCTFTNTRKTGQLTLVKVLRPVSDPGLFNLQIDDSDVITDVSDGGTTGPMTVETGTYTVGETAGTGTSLSDYSSSIICRDNGGAGSLVASGNDAGPLDVTVNEDDDILCTITNVRNPGMIVVIKETIQPHPQNFTFTTTLPVGSFTLDDPAADDGDGVTNLITYATVIPNVTYTITEDDPTPYGFELTDLACTETITPNSVVSLGSRTATLAIEPDEVVICVFTNTRNQISLYLPLIIK